MHPFRFNPPQVVAGSFFLLILTGSILLKLPWAAVNGATDYGTALFTATSAVCVTGLVVKDTASHWTPFGQVVILLLIQLGGLSIMSLATFYALLLGRRIPLRQRMIMQAALNKTSPGGIVSIFKKLLIFTLVSELLGASLLALTWMPEFGLKRSAFLGLFHAVSAFNNAGFDLFGNFSNLTRYVSDVPTNLIITTLIIIGGIGFVVVDEIAVYSKRRRLSLHARLALTTTAILVVLGTLFILTAEHNHALAGFPWHTKILAAYFQAVTPRTAGFNTLDLTSLYLGTQFFIIILMFIGGSPGSTAGGIKTVTFSVVWAAILSQMRGKRDVELFHRRIPYREVTRALAIIALSGFYVFAIILLLSFVQKGDLLKIVFEVISAFGTVGLSLNYSTELNTLGRLLIMLTMFIGRVGPLTLAVAFAFREKQADFRYAEEDVMIG